MKIIAISIADWSEFCEGMPLELEGLFGRMVRKMYSREGGLIDDDRENARLFGGLDPRVFRRLKDKLLAWPGALVVVDGLLINERAMKDIAEAKVRRTSRGLSAEARGKSGRSSNASYIQQLGKTSSCEASSPSPSPSPIKKEQYSAPDGADAAPHQSGASARASRSKCATRTIADLDLEAFADVFPKARWPGPKAVRPALAKALSSGITIEAIVSAVREGRGISADPAFAPSPVTWLNGNRWEAAPRLSSSGKPALSAEDRERKRVERDEFKRREAEDLARLQAYEAAEREARRLGLPLPERPVFQTFGAQQAHPQRTPPQRDLWEASA